MQIDETHYETLEILREIIQYRQAVGIGRILNVGQAGDLGTIEANVFVPDFDFQLPPAGVGRFFPFLVVDRIDFAVPHDAFQLLHHGRPQAHLSADDAVVLVVAIVGVPKFSARADLEFHKFVSKSPF